MFLNILYGQNEISKRLLNQSDKYDGICYHKKSKAYIRLKKKTKKKVSNNKSINFFITVKKPRDKAAYELLSRTFKTSKIYNLKNKKYSPSKKNIELLNYKKILNQIKKKIIKSDFISFDLFETLIDKTLSRPYDTYDYVNFYLKKDEYIRTRFEIEKKLIKKSNFTFNYENIIQEMIKTKKFRKKECLKIIKKEQDIEVKSIIPRKEVIDLVLFAKKLNKKIILTSDTWHNKEFIKKILRSLNLDVFNKIYLSSEEKYSKYNGEIYSLIKKENRGKILHIGDNIISDYQNAKKKKIQSVIIPSLDELILNSKFSGIYAYNQNIFSKLALGMIKKKISKILFLCLKKNKSFLISSFRDFGYLFYGPMILFFSINLFDFSNKQKIQKVLLCSREGFLLFKLLKYLNKYNSKNISMKYFLTSRKLSSMSSFRNQKDILDSFKIHRFEGNISELFKNRFGLNDLKKNLFNKNVKINSKENYKKFSSYVKVLSGQILKKSLITRQNYLKYLKRTIKNKKTLIVDQGYHGSVQKYLEKIMRQKYYGLYICHYMPSQKIQSFIDYDYSYFRKYQIFFESVFTAPHGTVIDINNYQNFIYEKKQKNQKIFKLKNLIFKGMFDFSREYIKLLNIKKNLTKIQYKKDCTHLSDFMFGGSLSNKKIIDIKILRSFYHDNFFVKNKNYRLKI